MSAMAYSLKDLGRCAYVTDYGVVTVSPSTRAAMDATYPGWSDMKLPRRKADRERAQRGARLLEQAVIAIAALSFEAGQELVSV